MFPIYQKAVLNWLREHTLNPCKEGAERINRFIFGKDLFLAGCPNLSWNERVVSLLTGAPLLLPFVNSAIWSAMNLFGHPQRFAD